eukprot:TRINITY_DN3845_c2_g1_i1.p1 TRINITY_DN3845_c2_g1~~TRINITY_DN3845_c2_g1_i1.p1  ORF type:complete len:356 (+),score=55.87 TRINITY_DN3845_c2_g1_i1:308-1375(+)
MHSDDAIQAMQIEPEARPARKSVVVIVPERADEIQAEEEDEEWEDDLPSPTLEERGKRGAYHKPRAPRPVDLVLLSDDDSIKSPVSSILSPVQVPTPPPSPVDMLIQETKKLFTERKPEMLTPVRGATRSPARIRKPPPQSPPPSRSEVTQAALARASPLRYGSPPVNTRRFVKNTSFAPPPPPIPEDPVPSPQQQSAKRTKPAFHFSRPIPYTAKRRSSTTISHSSVSVPLPAPGRKREATHAKSKQPQVASNKSKSSRTAGWIPSTYEPKSSRPSVRSKSSQSASHLPTKGAKEVSRVEGSLTSRRGSVGYQSRSSVPASFSRTSTGDRLVSSGVPLSAKQAYHRSHTDIRRR